jgi:hypothetical protein
MSAPTARLELDHVIVFTVPGAPVVDRLVEAGFAAGTPNNHPGQGTANRRVFFANAFLEFLFPTDREALASDLVAPTGLLPRFGDGCPLGAVLRTVHGQSPPFPTWDFRPPYLPDGVSIAMAASSNVSAEPLIAIIPFGRRPDGLPSERAQSLDHPAGPRSIRSARLAGPWPEPVSAALTALGAVPGVTVARQPDYDVRVFLEPGEGGHTLDLRPDAPILMSW